jgi:hypothetical protein
MLNGYDEDDNVFEVDPSCVRAIPERQPLPGVNPQKVVEGLVVNCWFAAFDDFVEATVLSLVHCTDDNDGDEGGEGGGELGPKTRVRVEYLDEDASEEEVPLVYLRSLNGDEDEEEQNPLAALEAALAGDDAMEGDDDDDNSDLSDVSGVSDISDNDDEVSVASDSSGSSGSSKSTLKSRESIESSENMSRSSSEEEVEEGESSKDEDMEEEESEEEVEDEKEEAEVVYGTGHTLTFVLRLLDLELYDFADSEFMRSYCAGLAKSLGCDNEEQVTVRYLAAGSVLATTSVGDLGSEEAAVAMAGEVCKKVAPDSVKKLLNEDKFGRVKLVRGRVKEVYENPSVKRLSQLERQQERAQEKERNRLKAMVLFETLDTDGDGVLTLEEGELSAITGGKENEKEGKIIK